jgi:hypothetical protein
MTAKDFVLDKVGWHTRVVGNSETRDQVIRRFWALSQFLARNGLLVQSLAQSVDEITDQFCIKSTDLTPEGLVLMRSAYERWLKRLDRGGDPTNVEILEKALKKLRTTK